MSRFGRSFDGVACCVGHSHAPEAPKYCTADGRQSIAEGMWAIDGSPAAAPHHILTTPWSFECSCVVCLQDYNKAVQQARQLLAGAQALCAEVRKSKRLALQNHVQRPNKAL